MLIIIDGYNLLYAVNEVFGYAEREDLLDLILSYKKRKNNNIVVIFDGGLGHLKEIEENFKGIKVIYTGSSKTADDVIKRLALKYKNGCVVISSDRNVKDFSDKAGCGVMKSEDFAMKLYDLYDVNDDKFSVKKYKRKEKHKKILLKKV